MNLLMWATLTFNMLLGGPQCPGPPGDLTTTLTTPIWFAPAQHVVVNFGLYPYVGHVPNHLSVMEPLVPQEHAHMGTI